MIDKQGYKEELSRMLLKYLDINNPTPKQIERAGKLLLRVKIDCEINFDPKLSLDEVKCLFLIAHGYKAPEIAKELELKLSTVESCQKEIRRKLKCRTGAEAVHRGMKLGIIPPWGSTESSRMPGINLTNKTGATNK